MESLIPVIKNSEYLQQVFCDILKQIKNKILGTHKNYETNSINPLENAFNLYPTSTEEVQSYIKTLKNNKSTGPSSIPDKLFKQFKKRLSEPLTLLINLTFSEGKFPAILKMGKIIPVYKKGCKTEVTNYRPISLLSNISKWSKIGSICFLNKGMLFIIINSDSKIIIQLIML